MKNQNTYTGNKLERNANICIPYEWIVKCLGYLSCFAYFPSLRLLMEFWNDCIAGKTSMNTFLINMKICIKLPKSNNCTASLMLQLINDMKYPNPQNLLVYIFEYNI